MAPAPCRRRRVKGHHRRTAPCGTQRSKRRPGPTVLGPARRKRRPAAQLPVPRPGQVPASGHHGAGTGLLFNSATLFRLPPQSSGTLTLIWLHQERFLQENVLTADRSTPVCLTVKFLNLKEKHSNLYNYLAKCSSAESVRLSLVGGEIMFQERHT